MTQGESETDVNILGTKVGSRCWQDAALVISGLEKVAFRLVFEDQARACRQPLWVHTVCG